MKNKYLMLFSHGITKSGNSLHDVVFILLCIDIFQDNTTNLSIILTIKFLPYLFFGYLGGNIADKVNKKRLMIITDIFRLALVSALAFLAYTNSLDFLWISIITFLLTLCRCFYQPAQQSAIPVLFNKQELPSINRSFQVSEEIGTIIGPLAAGMLIGHGNYWFALVMDCMTYFISLLMISFVKYPSSNKEFHKQSTKKEGKKSAIPEILKNKMLFESIFCSSLCIFFISGILRLIIPVYLIKDLYYPDFYLGWFMSVLGAGTVFGAYIYKYFESFQNTPTIYWSLYGISLLMVFLTENQYILLFFSFLIGLIGAFVDICLVSSIQRFSESMYMGKSFSIFSTLANSGEALSNIIVGFILTYMVTNVAGAIFSIACILTPIIFISVFNYKKIQNKFL